MAKVQPIESVSVESDSVAAVVVKPVVKSILRRLFRISAAEKDELPPPMPVVSTAVVVTEEFEPSSVCLANMVKNYIEENNENQVSLVRCGRNRCNCFVGGGSDGDDGENDSVSPTVVCDFLKRLVVSTSVNEMNVLADTARVVAEKNKVRKRKDELRKIVMEGLMALGYDSAICKSKWEKSASFPAGEYEYVDVIVEGERLIIDIDFRSEFEVAKSTKTYKSILQTLPNIFVGKSDRLSKIICIISEAAKQSLKKKGMHFPPWRKANYVQAKWLSPPTRLVANLNLTEMHQSSASHVSHPTDLSLSNTHQADESEAVSSSSQPRMVFDMSKCPDQILIPPSKNLKIVTGWASSIMKEKP